MAPKPKSTVAPATLPTETGNDVGQKEKLPPPLKRKYQSNEIIVNNKSSFKSHLVRCQKIIDNMHYDQLVIKSVGNATTRALNLAMQLNANNFDTFELQPREFHCSMSRKERAIRGADKDGFDPDSADRLKLVQLPALDIVVRKSKMEIDSLRKARSNNKERTPGSR